MKYSTFTLIVLAKLTGTWTIRFNDNEYVEDVIDKSQLDLDIDNMQVAVDLDSIDTENIPDGTDSSMLQSQTSTVQTSLEKPRQHKVLYGIESCNKSAYNLMVETQLQTWGAHLPRENFVIVGGARDDFADKLVAEESPCTDKPDGLACKEAIMLLRAADRVRTTGADWLSVGQDDKYIWTKELDEAVRNLDPSEPVVFAASFGCGMGWKFTDKGKQGLPPGKGWLEPKRFACKGTWEKGSICGGAPYIVSRGALELFRKKGQTHSEFVEEFLSHGEKGKNGQPANSDLSASCFFYGKGIPIRRDANNYRYVSFNINEENATKEFGEGGEGVFLFRKAARKPPIAAHLFFPKDDIPSVIKRLHLVSIPPPETPKPKKAKKAIV